MEEKKKDSNEERHRIACEKAEDFYLDIESGYKVMTGHQLKKREKCCGLGCRHCPFKDELDGSNRRTPFLLRFSDHKVVDLTSVLFWSGGKDGYIAYLEYTRTHPDQHVTLLNTFDPDLKMIGLHNISVKEVKKQAKHLKIDILLVPITKEKEYTETIKEGLTYLEKERGCKIKELLTGDLHLQTIIQWREKNFGDEYKFTFPLLNYEYDILIDILEKSEAKCIVCATEDENVIKIGDTYNKEKFQKLPMNIDRFGENGEFHTVIKFD